MAASLKFVILSVTEWRAIFWARRRLVEIDRDLNRFGLGKTKAALELKQPSDLFLTFTQKKIVRTINRAARLSIGRHDNCLRKSVLLWWILKQQGVASTLRIGVVSTGGLLSGHAWVEVNSEPINDRKSNIEAYRVINVESSQ